MDVFAEVEQRVGAALVVLKTAGALPKDLDVSGIEVAATRDAAHGEVAVNAAMVLSKRVGMKPRDLADLLIGKLSADKAFAKIEVAGPGFINITLAPAFWHDLVRTILRDGKGYGASGIGNGESVNVEYVSANPTGPMHVGHCRGAVFGDALANLLAFTGYKVTREYYINDAGGQVDQLARSAHLRYREALGEKIGDIPEGLYPGDYLVTVGQALAKDFGKKFHNVPESEWLAPVRSFAIDRMLEMIKNDLAALNIHHDVFVSEASLTRGTDKVKIAIDALREKGLIYQGRLAKPLGHDDDEWEDREQTLFKSTEFGDDQDRALQKSGGGYTYFAGDIAYHFDKLQRGYRHLVNVFGADHIGYIPRMLAAVAAFAGGTVERDAKGKPKFWHTTGGVSDLDIKVVQLVKLFKAGEPFKMSKRAGTFVTLRDVVDEVGRDPVRFMMLYRKELEPLDFDFAKVTEQSKDNPVFYVQYAHARSASVFRNAGEAFPDLSEPSATAVVSADLSDLTDPGELALIRQLSAFPRMIAGAARSNEPHRLAFYLYDLASALHGQWSRGNDLPHLRFIQPDQRGKTAARLALIAATKQVISTGLSLLGVEAPEVMR